MMKDRLPLVVMVVAGAALLVALLFLSLIRKSVPVHIDAGLTRLTMKLAGPTSRKERLLVQNLPLESITISYCSEIELTGYFSDSATSPEIVDLRKLRLVPSDSLPSVTLVGDLRLENLIVGSEARVEITRPAGLKITEVDSSATVFMDGVIKLWWEGFEPHWEDGQLSEEIPDELSFQPDQVFQYLTAHSTEKLLNLYLTTKEGAGFTLEEEIPVAELGFVRQVFAATDPGDLTTALQTAEITLPTLPDEKPIVLPPGSYLKINNLRDFIVKQIRIEPRQEQITAILYGFTSDLQAAYGPGKLTQLLPASLILLRQNASFVAVLVIMLWFMRTALNFYDRWQKKG
jgi:hypothetical protein